ncbi:MAG TPA: DUF1501 domain-containing protein [Aggregatilineales bacterium]|nr:DUF1501 domain-containing protein [Anaerolineales bacterium]HRE47088.1 DUF1501 domain-containing protein [Aggregatilineales bacterium]
MINRHLSRRDMLQRSAALSALASASMIMPAWMPRLSFSSNALRGDILVCIFLRGGADGLNLIVPHGEKAYYAARPTLAVPRPDDTHAESPKRALDLDGFFGLNPLLAPLHPIFTQGHLTAIHAAGSPDPTRSHFDAMSYMERGTPGSYDLSSGWIGRHLATLDTQNDSAVRAVGWGTALQASLRGFVNAVSLKSIVDYHLAGDQAAAADMLTALNTLYTTSPEALGVAAAQTQGVLDLVGKLNVASYVPANGARYTRTNEFDLALMQTAALIKAEVGMEVAAIDLGGWDTHEDQTDSHARDLPILANGLAAFYADLGDLMGKVTVVIMSEFGRRLQENGSNGTDHGHGNMMMVMGGSVAKTPVISQWPGLQPEQLNRGDLAITMDYRDVLSEILSVRLGNPHIREVFPNFTPTERGVVRGSA